MVHEVDLSTEDLLEELLEADELERTSGWAPSMSGADLSCRLMAGCDTPSSSAVSRWLRPSATIARSAVAGHSSGDVLVSTRAAVLSKQRHRRTIILLVVGRGREGGVEKLSQAPSTSLLSLSTAVPSSCLITWPGWSCRIGPAPSVCV